MLPQEEKVARACMDEKRKGMLAQIEVRAFFKFSNQC